MPRRRQLDSLRTFAVAGVLLQHLLKGSVRFAPFGGMGVKLFFVLSGFLITEILLECRMLIDTTNQSAWRTVGRFYVRRFLRIVPVFYLVLCCAYLANVDTVRTTVLWHALYASNVYLAWTGLPLGAATIFWTLSVEEQFYLVWPWVVAFAPRKRLLPIVIGAIVSACLFRALGVLAGYDPARLEVLPFACLDTLGLGALLAVLNDRASGREGGSTQLTRLGLWLGAPALIFQLVLRYKYPSLALSTFVSFDLTVGLCALWLVGRASRGFDGMIGALLDSIPLVYVGTISYGVYLIHTFLSVVAYRFTSLIRWQHGIPGVTVIVVLIVLFAIRRFMRAGSAFRWVDRLQPAALTLLATAAVGGVLYASARVRLVELGTMNSLMHLTIATGVTVAIASISWEMFERNINEFKSRFPYRMSPLQAMTQARTAEASVPLV